MSMSFITKSILAGTGAILIVNAINNFSSDNNKPVVFGGSSSGSQEFSTGTPSPIPEIPNTVYNLNLPDLKLPEPEPVSNIGLNTASSAPVAHTTKKEEASDDSLSSTSTAYSDKTYPIIENKDIPEKVYIVPTDKPKSSVNLASIGYIDTKKEQSIAYNDVKPVVNTSGDVLGYEDTTKQQSILSDAYTPSVSDYWNAFI